MLRALRESQLTGQSVLAGDFDRIPEAIIKDENRHSRSGYTVAREVREAFERYSPYINGPGTNAGLAPLTGEEIDVFEDLSELLIVVANRVCEQREGEGGENQQDMEFSRAFTAAGGWKSLLTFSMEIAIPVVGQKKRLDPERKSLLLDISGRSMLILKDLCANVPELAEALGAKDEIISTLLQALNQPFLYDMAGLLCEELLLRRREEVFDLRNLPDFAGLVQSMNACQLLLFCRLVSPLALDPEERAVSSDGKPLTAFNLLDQRRSAAVVELLGGDAVTSNHYQLILTARETLGRLVQLLDDAPTTEDEKLLWLSSSPSRWKPLDNPDVLKITYPPPASLKSASKSSANAPLVTSVPETSTSHQASPTVVLQSSQPASSSSYPADQTQPLNQTLAICHNLVLVGAKLFLQMARRMRSSLSHVVARILRGGERHDSRTNSGSGLIQLINSFAHSIVSRIFSSLQDPPQEEPAVPTEVPQSIPLINEPSVALLESDGDEELDDGLLPVGIEEDDEHDWNDSNIGESANGFIGTDLDSPDGFIINPQFWSNVAQRDMWLLSQRLEIAFVLCTLCIGPYRRLAQDILAHLDLVSVLTTRFDKLPWDPNLNPNNLPASARLHGAGCECDAFGAFKAQLLRLVHNYCDREADNWANKSKMFSESELESLKWDYVAYERMSQVELPSAWGRVNITFPPLPAFPTLGPAANLITQLLELDAVSRLSKLGIQNGGVHTDHGLAWRVAAVLISSSSRHPQMAESSLRFWEYAAVESLLRGSPEVVRLMICSWGVLEVVVKGIFADAASLVEGQQQSTENNSGSAGGLQASFDLLGELIKQNPLALAWLCNVRSRLLGEFVSDNMFERLAEIALNHLIDGNVFLRAVALTVSAFPNDSRLNKAQQWVLKDHAVKTTVGLVMVVGLEGLSQDNLCCLNSAVVLMTFARWDNRLEKFIRDVLESESSSWDSDFTSQFISSTDPLPIRFRKLIWFWRCYYSCRSIDRNSLQFSSGLLYSDLSATVDEICRIDRPGGSMLAGHEKIHVPYMGTSLPVKTDLQLVPWGLM